MAKVSKVNIAITGDSKGLTAATAKATRDLKALETSANATRNRLGAMRQTTNQTAEALAKLGVSNRGLGAAGGLLGLAGMGTAGFALGGLGIAAAAAGALVAGVQGVPAQRKGALQALEESRMDARRRIEDLGFTKQLAEAIAAGRKDVSVAEMSGVMESFSKGLATGGGTSLAESLINEIPKVMALQIGAMLAGKSMTEQGALIQGYASSNTQSRLVQIGSAYMGYNLGFDPSAVFDGLYKMAAR